VRATDLDHIDPLRRFRSDGGDQGVDPGQRVLTDGDQRRDVHRGHEAVVGRLAHVHVVVRMDGVVRAELGAE
jgi:hypothetical protein